MNPVLIPVQHGSAPHAVSDSLPTISALLVALLFCRAALADTTGLPTFTPLPALQANLQAPERVAVDGQCQVYVCDPQAGQVLVLDAFGRQVLVRPTQVQPLGLAVDGAGTIYVGDAQTGAVNVFDHQWNPAGQLGQGPGEFRLPGHIAVAANGGATTVFVTDSLGHCVKAYREGVRVGQFGSYGVGPAQFDFPAGIWASPDGKLYIVDQNNERVQVLDHNGNFLRWFGLQAPGAGALVSGRPQGIVGDSQGRLFVADTFQGYVKVFDIAGSFLGYIGSYGQGPGQLRSPSGVALDPLGRLWVTSAGNGRVEGFGLDCFAQLSVNPPVQTVAAGTTVTFAVTNPCPGAAAVQWLKDQMPLTDGGTISGATNSALTLTGVTADDSGSYSVSFSGPAGTTSSPEARLEVVSAPTIITGPVSQTVPQGGSVTLSVTAQGSGLGYQWMQDGVPLVGAQQSTLVITNVQPFAAGMYSVQAANAAGSATSSPATLAVVLLPVITEPPLDRIAPAGSVALFNVTLTRIRMRISGRP